MIKYFTSCIQCGLPRLRWNNKRCRSCEKNIKYSLYDLKGIPPKLPINKNKMIQNKEIIGWAYVVLLLITLFFVLPYFIVNSLFESYGGFWKVYPISVVIWIVIIAIIMATLKE